MTERLIDRAFKGIEERSPEQLTFCVAFSLLEYAIKECVDQQNPSGRAKPNWGSVAQQPPDLRRGASQKTIEAIDYVLNDPPQVQIVVKRRAQFRERSLEGTENERVAEALKRIRNNLFHGGKRPYDDRDEKLVQAGLEIIERYFQLHADLRRAALASGMIAPESLA
jgi:hypothetical protein